MTKSEMNYEKNNSFSLENTCESNNLLRNLRAIIEAHQNESAKNLGMSILHLFDGNHNDALKCLKSLAENNPNISQIHRRIAEIYISQDDFKSAVGYLENALKLDKEDLMAKMWLGLIHYELGNEKKAKICLNLLKDDVFILNASKRNWFEQEN